MTTTILFFEGSHQFRSETTNLRVNPAYIQYELFKQYEYSSTEESLWAILKEEGKEVCRFELDIKENTFNQYIFWKMATTDNSHNVVKSRVLAESKTHFRVIFNKETGQTSDISKDLLVQ